VKSRFGNIEVKAITCQNQYEEYLSLIDKLMDDDPDTTSQDGILLETLVTLVEDFEKDWMQ